MTVGIKSENTGFQEDLDSVSLTPWYQQGPEFRFPPYSTSSLSERRQRDPLLGDLGEVWYICSVTPPGIITRQSLTYGNC